MSRVHDRELQDVLATERAKRKPARGKKPAHLPHAQLEPLVTDPTYQRIRATITEESLVDADGHAARITLVVLDARARRADR